MTHQNYARHKKNKVILKKVVLIWFSILSFNLYSFSQWDSLKNGILKQDSLIINEGLEKIFCHFDKYYYQPDDTLRLSGYVINSLNGRLFDSSKIIYLDIINSNGKSIKRISTSNVSGKFNINIYLKESLFSPGLYYVAAYTNHLLNYAVPVPFLYHFIISKDELNSNWKIDLLNYAFTGNSIMLKGKISGPQKVILNQMFKLFIHSDKSDTLTFVPEKDGGFIAELPYRKNITAVKIEIQHESKTEPPITFYTPNIKPIKLEFFPEGGILLYGKSQKIGIKVTGSIERGMPVKGIIVNKKNEPVSSFSINKNGIGSVQFIPQKEETYKAIVNSRLEFELPPIRNSGTSLCINEDKKQDSIKITVYSSVNFKDSKYFLRASSQGVSVAMGLIHLRDGYFSMKIAKRIIPKGICHFVLYNENNEIVNERNIFIDKLKCFKIDVERKDDASSDSLKLSVNTTFTGIENTVTSLSNLSVSIVNANSLSYNLDAVKIQYFNYLLSELDNSTEHYLQNTSLNSFEDVDNLLLTQKYIEPYFVSKGKVYSFEKKYTVTGKVLNLLKKPIGNAQIYLLGREGKKYSFFIKTESAKNGTFMFDNFPIFQTDSIVYLFTTKRKNGNVFIPSILIDEIEAPVYKIKPIVTNTIFLKYKPVTQNFTIEHSKIKLLATQKSKEYLQEVIVIGKVTISGSKNLNPDGGADITIGTARVQQFPKETLLEILYKTIPGFIKGPINKFNLQVYKVKGSLAVFTIDGYNINKYYDPVSESNEAFVQYCNTYLNYLNAEDIKGIEVMESNKYKSEYEKEYGIPYTSNDKMTFTFIEITTFSGNGAFLKHSPNSLQYLPTPPIIYNSVYSPSLQENVLAYIKGANGLKTLYWNAALNTAEYEKVHFYFVKPDDENDYIIVIQGIDEQGRIGYYTEYLNNVIFKPN